MVQQEDAGVAAGGQQSEAFDSSQPVSAESDNYGSGKAGSGGGRKSRSGVGVLKAKTKKKKLRPVAKPPVGLQLTQLLSAPEQVSGESAVDVAALLTAARDEAEGIINTHCEGQLARNQHFFVQLPFPLSRNASEKDESDTVATWRAHHDGYSARERDTPLFDLEDARVASVVALVRLTMASFAYKGEEQVCDCSTEPRC